MTGDIELRDALLETLQALQAGVPRLLHAIGLAPDVHGQPAWPLAQRLAIETLAIDGGLTRQFAAALACAAVALLLALTGALWRRARWPAWAATVGLLILAPWPPRAVLLSDAVPTSFHRSPTGFDAVSIERGLALYQAHCAGCHGSDGRGETPRAATLPVWPPRLSGTLLWRRADGEVFWRILYGLHDRQGVATMPGYADQLDDAQLWALIDAMKALAAGAAVRDESAWPQPVRAPDARVRCGDGRPDRRIAELRGQRLRLVARHPGDAVPPDDDPRLLTIALQGDRAGPLPRGGCAITDAEAFRAYARIAGAEPAAFAGAQLLVDRDGWLRAYGRPGSRWSASDLLCRSPGREPAQRDAGGLDALIAAMDADPVRGTGLGLAHRR